MSLSNKESISILAHALVAAFKRASFTVPEVAQIIHKDKKFVNVKFNECGIRPTLQGNTKHYNAVAVAEYLHMNQVSPLLPVKGSGANRSRTQPPA